MILVMNRSVVLHMSMLVRAALRVVEGRKHSVFFELNGLHIMLVVIGVVKSMMSIVLSMPLLSAVMRSSMGKEIVMSF